MCLKISFPDWVPQLNISFFLYPDVCCRCLKCYQINGIILGWICLSENKGGIEFELPKLLYSGRLFCLLRLQSSHMCVFLAGLAREWSLLLVYMISDGSSVFFSIGGPLCGFLCTALYPAQVPGRTKLYLLPDGWSPVGLE